MRDSHARELCETFIDSAGVAQPAARYRRAATR